MKYISCFFLLFLASCNITQDSNTPLKVIAIEQMKTKFSQGTTTSMRCLYTLRTNQIFNGDIFYIEKCGMYNIHDSLIIVQK